MTLVRQRTTAAPSVRVLRYRFDDVQQLLRHLHAANGRVVMFYPCLLALQPRDQVLVDVTFIGSAQHCPMRGTVIGRDAADHHVGCWIEFASPRLLLSMRRAAAGPRRNQRRFATDVAVVVERSRGMPVIGKIVDVSMGGACITGVGIKAVPRAEVRLSLVAGEHGGATISARVAWVRGSEMGVAFTRLLPAERAAIVVLVDAARTAMANVYETIHPGYCACAAGGPVSEPSLPRALHRFAASF